MSGDISLESKIPENIIADHLKEFNDRNLNFANMSHEIRTPLNAIIGMIYLLSKTPLAADQAGYIEKLGVTAKNLLGIINDILDVSKIEANQMTLDHREFSLQTLIEDVLNPLRILAEDNKIRLHFEIQGDLPKFLKGDEIKLKQVLANLVSNSIKFTKSGEVLLLIKGTKIKFNEKSRLLFSVEDTGIGIKAEDIPRIFNPFVQIEGNSGQNFSGTGLGLSISQKLVQLMGGVLQVESQFNQGSRFFFEIDFLNSSEQLLLPKNFNLNSDSLIWFIEPSQKAQTIFKGLFERYQFKGGVFNTFNDLIPLFSEYQKNSQVNETHYFFIDKNILSQSETMKDFFELKKNVNLDRCKIYLVGLIEFSEIHQVIQDPKKEFIDCWMVSPLYPWNFLNSLQSLTKDPFVYMTGIRRLSRAVMNYRLEGKNILLVEDNEVNRLVSTDILEKSGANVITAIHGLEALEILNTTKEIIHLILLDLQMPIMDGYETIQKIQENLIWKSIPVIAMTAHSIQDEKNLCIEKGMKDYLTKPVDPDFLLKTISQWCNPDFNTKDFKSNPRTSLTQNYIDWEIAFKNVGENQTLIINVAKKFIRDFQEIPGAMSLWIKEGRLVQTQRTLLSLRAFSGFLGAMQLRKIVENLENAIRENKIKELNDRWLEFNENLNSVILELSEYLSKNHFKVLD